MSDKREDLPLKTSLPKEKAMGAMETDYLYKEDFSYKHKNPYHEKLEQFDEFVLRDEQAEKNPGHWNENIFKRQAPLCVEIGTGYGHFMHYFCRENPEVNFVGLDFRFKRSFYLAKKLAKIEKRNFRYLRARGERLEFIFGESEVDNLFYFFPDPWPKKRHHKKRLFQMPFLRAAHRVLRPKGTLYIKTDHEGQAQWMADFLNRRETLQLFTIKLKTFDLYKEAPEHFLASFQTKFENIFLKQETPIKAFELISKK